MGFAEGTPILVGLAVKTLAATVGFVVAKRAAVAVDPPLRGRGAVRRGGRREYDRPPIVLRRPQRRPRRVGRPIMQTSPLFVIVLSFAFFQRLERVSRRLATASMIVVAGAACDH